MTGNNSPSEAGPARDDYDRGTYTAHCDWKSIDSPSSAIVRAVADVTGTNVTSVRPLYDAVDPDALDRFLTHGKASPEPRTIAFQFERCHVTVDAEGRIDIERLE